ncbi:FkbM family methyltransferase [Ruegeria arenilitoris]|uniref:FkbM family methyltransferase n=1 Tax=Ruegeria arenilitoris TaxID=1173585 RepID=UPI001479E353|nr:FkbM family methyltransferase [Ruegeria arenilitoris]
MKARLPSYFSFSQANDLVRIGRQNDGGYLVSMSDIEKSDLLIGLGICDDWSFENDFIKHKDVEVIAYDASVNFRFWLKRVLVETIKNPFSLHGVKKVISYRKFFQGKRRHIKKFVGLSTLNESHCTFLEVLNEAGNKNVFLKIDVEGSEYRFLSDILNNEDRVTGMVIELHDCDIHLDEIEEFIRKCGLSLVHIHANNYAPIRLDDNLPLVLELTFSKHAELSNSCTLPHKLDMPNNKNSPEYELLISDNI